MIQPSESSAGGRKDRVKFNPGAMYITHAARETVSNSEAAAAFAAHLCGDWGDVDAEDWAANDRALAEGARLLSAYRTKAGTKFWIITEGDRSMTTLLLPSDY